MGKYYKILLISFGLLLGIIIGGLIVFFAVGGSVKNIYVFNQSPKVNKENLINSKKEELSSTKKEKNNKSQVIIKYLKKDDENQGVDDKVKKEIEDDSSMINQTIFLNESETQEEEEIIVKKDELVHSEMLMIIHLDTIKSNVGDSLARLAANIKEPAINQFYQVEYWKSPLNYKGYKFGKNKLVVYGIEYIDKPSIFRIRENYYFKANTKVYALERTPEFKPLEIVNNPDVLNMIEKKSNAN
ncbi:MAG: hypothetical protein ACK4IK_07665 [Bacteroidia bacterium]